MLFRSEKRPNLSDDGATTDAMVSLLEEIVVVLVGRVYADASKADARAIEQDLQTLLDGVRPSDGE